MLKKDRTENPVSNINSYINVVERNWTGLRTHVYKNMLNNTGFTSLLTMKGEVGQSETTSDAIINRSFLQTETYQTIT